MKGEHLDPHFDPARTAHLDVARTASSEKDITPGLVHVRTPTYRRPEALERCLRSLIAQTHVDWICEVFDDDPDAAARDVVAALNDPRVRYIHNQPQLFASRNIDQCFTTANPHGAEYFCVVEDDNFIKPTFFAANIAALAEAGVEVMLRNQAVEFDSGKPTARVSRGGLLDQRLTERVYEPEHLRLAVLADIGVSNGGMFWSCRATSDLQVHVPCSAALQEYLRTFAVAEPIFVAMTPLAVWAENAEDTTRDVGADMGWMRRELAFKASVIHLQRLAWRRASRDAKARFLEDEAFRYSAEQRARGMVKSLVRLDVGRALPFREVAKLALRGALIRAAGSPEPSLRGFVADRHLAA